MFNFDVKWLFFVKIRLRVILEKRIMITLNILNLEPAD